MTRLQSGDVPCQACSRTDWTSLFRASSEDGAEHYDLMRCDSCGLAMTHPRPEPRMLLRHYLEDYYGHRHVKFEPLTESVVAVFTWWRAFVLSRYCPAGGLMLDIGCGRGNFMAVMESRGHVVSGTEFSSATADAARLRFGDKVHVGNLTDLPLTDGLADLAVMWHVLEHVPDPAAHLQRIRRLLKPGGYLAIAVPNFASIQSRISGRHWFHLDVPRHLWHFTPDTVARLIQQAGLTRIRQSFFSIEQNPFGWVQSILNRLGLPHNQMYKCLKRDSTRFPLPLRVLWRAAYALLMPPAILLSTLESLLGRGGTFYVVCQKRA